MFVWFAAINLFFSSSPTIRKCIKLNKRTNVPTVGNAADAILLVSDQLHCLHVYGVLTVSPHTLFSNLLSLDLFDCIYRNCARCMWCARPYSTYEMKNGYKLVIGWIGFIRFFVSNWIKHWMNENAGNCTRATRNNHFLLDSSAFDAKCNSKN